MGRNDAMPRRRVVAILRFSALGDVAMALPVAYSAAMSNSDTDFLFVTRAPFAAMLGQCPPNLRAVGLDFARFGGVNPMWGVVRLLRETYGVNLIIDLHDVLRTKLIRLTARLFGIRSHVIDKGRAEKRALTRSKNKIFRRLPPMVDRYRDVFRSAGIDPGDCFDGLHGLAPGAAAAGILPERRDGEIRIGIAPFARHKGKIYPPGLMEQAVGMLAEDSNVRLFFFGGGGDEAATLSRWADRFGGRAVSLAGRRLGLGTELAVMESLDVMVSMDSGNMHMASLAGIPVVSVWGATHPFCGFTGWRQSDDNIVQADMECRPCSVFGDKPCVFGDYRCMRAITPGVIAGRVRACLEKNRAGGRKSE